MASDFDRVADGACENGALADGGVLVWVCGGCYGCTAVKPAVAFGIALGFMERGLKLHDTMNCTSGHCHATLKMNRDDVLMTSEYHVCRHTTNGQRPRIQSDVAIRLISFCWYHTQCETHKFAMSTEIEPRCIMDVMYGKPIVIADHSKRY